MGPYRLMRDWVQVPARFPPGWIPCSSCLKPLAAHVGMKCPFDSTEFRPQDGRELWETYDDAWKIATYEYKWAHAFEDLVVADKVRCYMEAYKRRLLKKIKERDQRGY